MNQLNQYKKNVNTILINMTRKILNTIFIDIHLSPVIKGNFDMHMEHILKKNTSSIIKKSSTVTLPVKRMALFGLFVFSVGLLYWLNIFVNYPLISFDQTVAYLIEGNGEFLRTLRAGRFSLALLLWLFPSLAVSHFVTGVLYLACISLAAVFFVLLLSEKGSSPGLPEYMAALCLVVFPYWESQIYFTFYHMGHGLSVLMAVCSVMFVYPGFPHTISESTGTPHLMDAFIKNVLPAALLVALGTGFYQSFLHYFFCILFSAAASLLIRGEITYGKILRFFARGLAAGMSGALLYLALHKAVLHIFRLDNLPQLGEVYTVTFHFSLGRFFRNLATLFQGSELLLPTSQNIALAALFGVLLVFLRRKLNLVRFVLVLCCLGAAFASNVALALVSVQELALRTAVGVAFFWAFVVYALFRRLEEKFRTVLTFFLCVLFLGFWTNVNAAWRKVTEISNWDVTTAMQIAHDLRRFAQSKDLSEPYNVSLIGCFDNAPLPVRQDWDAISGYSMLACFGKSTVGQHPFGLFRRIGVKYLDFRPNRETDFARVANRKPWPAEEGIFMDEEGLAIWLGPVQPRTGLDEGFVGLVRALGIDDPLLSAGEGVIRPSQQWFLKAVEENPPGPWKAGTPMLPTPFAIDRVEAFDANYDRIFGWAYDLSYSIKPDQLYFLDEEGNIAGIGHTGLARPDLGKSMASMAMNSGFMGYVLKGKSVVRAVYPR